jgi:hypothetical protein
MQMTRRADEKGAIPALLVTIVLMCSGCASLNDGRWVLSAAEQIVAAVPVGGATTNAPSGSTGETPSTPTNVTEEVKLSWECGGVDGSKYVLDPSVRITSSRLTTSAWYYTQTPPEAYGWPQDGENDGKDCRTFTCLFIDHGDGVFRGGKMDWGYAGANPAMRPTSAHMQSAKPYKGHMSYKRGQRYAAVLLSFDGRRSQVVTGVVE